MDLLYTNASRYLWHEGLTCVSTVCPCKYVSVANPPAARPLGKRREILSHAKGEKRHTFKVPSYLALLPIPFPIFPLSVRYTRDTLFFFFFYCQSLCLLLLSFSHLIFLFLRLLRVYLVLDIYCKWYLSRFFLSFLHDMIILNLLSMNEDDFTNRKIKFFKILLLFNSHCYCEYSIETGLLEIYSNIFDCAWNSFNLNLGFRINPNVSE